jgi:hypothetical protein
MIARLEIEAHSAPIVTPDKGAFPSMQFLYPKSRQFPFDEVCEQIVRALEARVWKVPGFSIEFHDYGRGAQKLRYVSSIKSDQSAIDLGHHDVAIKFGRPQGLLPGGRWNDTAAVDEVQLTKAARLAVRAAMRAGDEIELRRGNV